MPGGGTHVHGDQGFNASQHDDWLVSTAAVIGWHVPTLFELGIQSAGWHEGEHVLFLVAGILFWWPVIRPWPSLGICATLSSCRSASGISASQQQHIERPGTAVNITNREQTRHDSLCNAASG